LAGDYINYKPFRVNLTSNGVFKYGIRTEKF
jgi:hypothetical protein